MGMGALLSFTASPGRSRNMAGESENLSGRESTNGKTASDRDDGPDEAADRCSCEDLAARVEQEARAVFQQVRQRAGEALELVKRHPGKSLVAAVLVGMFLGRLTRR
jgi:ElaB/YqjD/DUF883 family membrane-anchored ribosome-binding protein